MVTIIKTISVSQEYNKLAEEHRLSWTELARKGMGLMLAELGIPGYEPALLKKQMAAKETIEKQLQEANETIEELRAKIKNPVSENNSMKEIAEATALASVREYIQKKGEEGITKINSEDVSKELNIPIKIVEGIMEDLLQDEELFLKHI